MDKHTAGPWALESNTRGKTGSEHIITDEAGEFNIAAVHTGNGQATANARLVAAAPSLYEALLALRDYVCTGDNNRHQVLESVDEAIALAEEGLDNA